jgi:hypothetical protein
VVLKLENLIILGSCFIWLVLNGYKIGYATSANLFDWERKDSEAGIEYSKEGWDSTMHHYPHIFEVNGKHYMTYNGNDFGKFGFGLAVLENE